VEPRGTFIWYHWKFAIDNGSGLLTRGIAVKKTYEKPTVVKSSVRLQAVTAAPLNGGQITGLKGSG
jgi:hypothetical protein